MDKSSKSRDVYDFMPFYHSFLKNMGIASTFLPAPRLNPPLGAAERHSTGQVSRKTIRRRSCELCRTGR